MPAMTKNQPKTVVMDRGYNYQRKQQRLEEEEKEIARLEALARGEEVSDEEEEEESDGEGLEATEVQDAGDPEQEEAEEKSKAQEKDDNEELSAEEKSFKKRYGDLRRHMQEKEKEWEKRLKDLEAKNDANVRPPKSDEDLEAWAKEYPDVASIVETIASKKAQEMFNSAEDRFKELDRLNEETKIAKAESEIAKVHSDFYDLRSSDDFHNWAEEQPKWVQDALYENMDDPKSVVRVIDLYKVDKGLTPSAKKSKAKEAAKNVSTKSRTQPDAEQNKATFSESQVAKESDAWYEANEDKIVESMRNGTFVYDLSGGAR